MISEANRRPRRSTAQRLLVLITSLLLAAILATSGWFLYTLAQTKPLRELDPDLADELAAQAAQAQLGIVGTQHLLDDATGGDAPSADVPYLSVDHPTVLAATAAVDTCSALVRQSIQMNDSGTLFVAQLRSPFAHRHQEVAAVRNTLQQVTECTANTLLSRLALEDAVFQLRNTDSAAPTAALDRSINDLRWTVSFATTALDRTGNVPDSPAERLQLEESLTTADEWLGRAPDLLANSGTASPVASEVRHSETDLTNAVVNYLLPANN